MQRLPLIGVFLLSLALAGCSGGSDAKEPTALESIFTVGSCRKDQDVKDIGGSNPVLVFRADGEHAYMVRRGYDYGLSELKKSNELKFYAILGERGNIRYVPVEFMFTNKSGYYTVFRGPRNQLPGPIPRRPLPDVKIGDEFNCVWIWGQSYVEPPHFDIHQNPIKVASLGPLINGRPAYFDFQTNGSGEHGFITDTTGHIVAVFSGEKGRGRIAARSPGGAVWERGVFQEARMRVTRPSDDEVQVDFAIQTFHPFDTAREYVPQALVMHPTGAERGKALHLLNPTQPPQAKEFWIEVPLQKVERVDAEFQMPPPPSDWCQASHWYGSYRFREAEKGGPLWYKFNSFAGLGGYMALNATKTEPRLYIHPVGQNEYGKPISR